MRGRSIEWEVSVKNSFAVTGTGEDGRKVRKMQKLMKEYLDEVSRRQKRNRKIQIAVLLLAVIVIGSVAGILTQHGIAMTGKAKCGLEEHKHNKDCYEDVLVCKKAEGEGHKHTAECRYPKELICGMEEGEGHTHTEECYRTPEGYACGLEEGEGHTHTAECYQRKLICKKTEHTHTDVCYTDAAADVEDASVWDRQYAAVEWKEIWGEDLVTAAQLQLGYQESADNYEILSEGIHKGYTRYGQFMGEPYIDWDAAFVNFCLYYAGLSASNLFPTEADTAKWCEEFGKIREENAAYLTAPENYTPKAGDLVFFQREGEETGSQMGIVSSYETETTTVRVIEGNSGNEVRENAYNAGDSHIVSYLKITELEEAYKGVSGEPAENTKQEGAEEPEDVMEGRTMTADGPDYTVTVSFTAEAKIPKDAVLFVKEINPGSEEYQEYYRQSLQAMEKEEIGFARYFDVTFLLDGKEIEPSAPVDVKIVYADKFDLEEDASGNAVHFSKDGTEVLDAGINTEENSFTFTQSSFSVVGTVIAKANSLYYYKGGIPENLDGKTFLLETARGTDHMFLTGEETESSSGIRGLAGSAAEDLSSFENPQEENLWIFHRRNETAYYIQNVKSGTYLCINGPQVTLEEDAYELLVETKGDTITIRRGDYLLEADENRCITAAAREEGGPKSHNRFRLFGAGREYTLTAEEEDYRITLNLSAPDGLFDDTEFTAEEITGEEAEAYARKAQDALGISQPGFQRFFHLGFSKEIPDELIHVSSVVIQYKENAEGFDINGAGGVVSFKSGNDMIVEAADAESREAVVPQPETVEEEVLNFTMNGLENTISAEISELSDLGIMMLDSGEDLYYNTYIENADDLDGKEFLISNFGVYYKRILGGTAVDTGRADRGLRGYEFAGNNVVNRSEEIALWTFEKQSNGTFTIRQSGTNNYLRIENTAVTLGSAQELSIGYSDGKITIGRNGYYLNSYGGSNPNSFKFAGWNSVDNNVKMTLYAKQEISPLTFEVESAQLSGTSLKDAEPDGTVPQIPLSVSVTLDDAAASVALQPYCTVRSGEGANKRFEFERVQILYREGDVETVKAVDSVRFSTDGKYRLSFYNNNSLVGTYDPDQVTIQFGYRGHRKTPLDIEPSLSTKGKIDIKMANYPSQQFTGWLWTNSEKGVKQGILNPYLDTNEYPSFAHPAGYNTGGNKGIFQSGIGTDTLEDYFSSAIEADNLFVEDKYIHGGYYEYSSLKNGAVFDETTGNFTLYKQLTTIGDSNGTEAENKLKGKGQFLPYNTFDTDRKLANMKNTYTARDEALTPADENYGADLFLPDEGSPVYYYGLEMSAEFYQMHNGRIGTKPMRYEFTGDDDLWVYIDGVLVLDMGGCHDAKHGYVDFSTGEVYVEDVPGSSGFKTLHELFVEARDKAVEDNADPKVIADLNAKLEPSKWKRLENGNEIFADYTKHDFHMWYMERGGGGSNLEVKFNLPMIPPGEVQIEKQLENSEQGQYVNKAFNFEVYLQPIDGAPSPGGEDIFLDTAKENYRKLDTELLTEGRTNAQAFVVRIDGTEEGIPIPTNGIFHLKPGEKLILRGLKANRKYYVRERDLLSDEYSGVNVDQILVEEKEDDESGSAGGSIDISQDKSWADTDIKMVSERAYVAFKNVCSEENRNALLIKKELTGDRKEDTYEYRIWLEDQEGGLKLYEGNYYLIDKDGYYYSRNAVGDLLKSSHKEAIKEISRDTPVLATEEGKPGIISGILPEYTVIIRNLLAGTKFLVEEAHPGLWYEDPVYELTEGTYQKPAADLNEIFSNSSDKSDNTDRSDNTEQKKEMGSIMLGKNAEVTVKNNRLDERTWHIVKKSLTEDGPFLEAVFELSSSDGKNTYYGKSSADSGKITWYQDRNCTQSLWISDLVTGTYTLKEIEAPRGYALSEENWSVEIQPRNGVSIAGQEPKPQMLQGTDGTDQIQDFVYTFYNKPVYELPDAGGPGIYWYLIGGMLLMMAGALILYRNKCREVPGIIKDF